MSDSRRFQIRTYGCQMNVHDSQKIANLMLHAGYQPSEAEADLLIINTCSIRDKAENQLYSDLGKLGDWKLARPGRTLGVGGCVAQQVGDAILKRFPQVDFVFGTHNLRWVPAMAAAAERGERAARTEESRSQDRFDLPSLHPSLRAAGGRELAAQAFVTVMEGCDMFCSFCIVPQTRGREISRPVGSIVEEVEGLAERGVREITLLGQTVNAYGRHDVRRGRSQGAGTVAFGQLLRRLDAIPGLDRIRYTSPHPAFFDDDLIGCHGVLERLCPHVHLPLQSGADSVLERMHRRYTRDHYLSVARALRQARPDLVLTTDLIVGHPGETEAEFVQTLDLMREVGFADSYSFKFSPRPGTAAAELPDRIEPGEAQERLERVQGVQRELTVAYHRQRVGGRTVIRVEGESRRPGQIRGRDPYHRVVNVGVSGELTARPGELVEVEIVEATPHSLIGTPTRDPTSSLTVGHNPHSGAFGESLDGENRLKPGARSAEERSRSEGLADPATATGALRVP